jgi:hypothetical protein
MVDFVRLYLVLLVAACGSAQHPNRPTQGSIAGLARDHDSGDAVAHADVHVRLQGEMKSRLLTTDKGGGYRFDHLAPGKYSVEAMFAGQVIDIENVDIRAGTNAVVDLTFTLGRPDPIHYDFGNPKDGAIDHYHPRNLSPSRSLIEGTVSDVQTRGRVTGAVVYAVDQRGDAQSAVSDEAGRYHIDVYPGTYAVSAYYAVDGRGSIEVRRGGVHVDGAEAAVVPLWVELQPQ